MLDFISQHFYALAVGIATLLLLAFVIWVRRTREFYWTDFWYSFPYFGGLSRSIRQKDLHPVRDDLTGETITPAQQGLISTYFNQIGVITRERFNRAYQFLLLAKQSDRRPMPVWGLPVLFVLLVAEALGFGMLLAPFIAAEITPNAAEVIGVVIAFVMAIIAAGLTHAAGAEFYEHGLIRKMRRIANNGKIILYRHAIANDEDQDQDQAENDVTRFGNRALESVEDKGGVKFIVSALLFILVVLVASSLLRYENLRLQVTQQSALQANSGAAAGGNPFAAPVQAPDLPPAVAQNAQSAQQAVQVEENSEQLLGGLAGIIGLGVIFVFTQVYSMSLGIKYGHLDRARIKAAYKNGTLGYSSYEDYRRYILDPRVRRTERRLQQLKNGLFHDSPVPPSALTFSRWLDVKMEQESAQLTNARRAGAPAESPEPVDNSSSLRVADFIAAEVAESIMQIPDTETRRAQLRSVVAPLTQSQRELLRTEIQGIKERREAAASWIDEV